MVDEINSWIKNGCNYTEGVGLYEKYGSNAFMKGLFKRGETSVNRQKLNELLVELRNVKPKPAPAAPITPSPVAPTRPVTAAPASVTVPPAAIAQQPSAAANPLPALLQVTQQRDQTFAEIRSLHALLLNEPEGESLKMIAQRIVRLGKKNAELWERYNYLTEHSGEPDQVEAPIPPVMIDLNLIAKREQIRKSLNKAENRIKGQEKPNEKTVALIKLKRLQLKEIDEKIAAIKNGGQS